ncbi:hypothetical protein AB0M57_08600 [Streptomyces sp. NPDC051597]|uniref:hypothetical protein n=1 Tax=Streptomyces sp. NPDC051597 TaxID=3155049 RepID=UPI0034130424
MSSTRASRDGQPVTMVGSPQLGKLTATPAEACIHKQPNEDDEASKAEGAVMDDDQQDPARQKADEILEALKTPQPRLSEYDKKRLDELNSANVPFFWIGYAVVVFGGFWLLIKLLDWWHSL